MRISIPKLTLNIFLIATAILSPALAQQTGTPAISGELTLADAVQTALKNSPMVRSAGVMASAAQARVGMAQAMTRPQVSSSAFLGNSSMGDIITSPPGVMPSGVFSVPDKSAITGQFSAMIPLYTGGRLSGAVKSAKALSAAAASDRASMERNVTLETKVAYHQALLARATIGVYEDLVKEEQERVRIAEAAFNEGKIAKYDLLRNQAGLAESQQQLANAQRDAQVALVNLKTTLGVSQSSDITLQDQLTYAQTTNTLDSYLADAENNRSEIIAARSRVESANSNVDVAKGAYKPQVYGSAMHGLTAASGGIDSGFTVGITIGLPLIDGGQRRAAVNEAKSMLEAAKQDEQQALLGIHQDVHTVWAELQAADKNVELSGTAVEQAQEDYRVIKLRYEAGKAVNVEVLDALASLVRARNNQLMALYEHNIARDRLARAIGEL